MYCKKDSNYKSYLLILIKKIIVTSKHSDCTKMMDKTTSQSMSELEIIQAPGGRGQGEDLSPYFEIERQLLLLRISSPVPFTRTQRERAIFE